MKNKYLKWEVTKQDISIIWFTQITDTIDELVLNLYIDGKNITITFTGHLAYKTVWHETLFEKSFSDLLEFENIIGFFKSSNTDYMDWLRKETMDIFESVSINSSQYRIITENSIMDIISEIEPIIHFEVENVT
jgi:hypothetical protein